MPRDSNVDTISKLWLKTETDVGQGIQSKSCFWNYILFAFFLRYRGSQLLSRGLQMSEIKVMNLGKCTKAYKCKSDVSWIAEPIS